MRDDDGIGEIAAPELRTVKGLYASTGIPGRCGFHEIRGIPLSMIPPLRIGRAQVDIHGRKVIGPVEDILRCRDRAHALVTHFRESNYRARRVTAQDRCERVPLVAAVFEWLNDIVADLESIPVNISRLRGVGRYRRIRPDRSAGHGDGSVVRQFQTLQRV